ncbi:unnamed protein product [Brassica oleracea var. botrytis]
MAVLRSVVSGKLKTMVKSMSLSSRRLDRRMDESREFVNELFEALVRRRGTTSITKTEVFDFWEQIAGM